MAWLIVNPAAPSNGGGGTVDNSGSVPWHIIEDETITVPTRREMALHGEFLNEGNLVLEGTARLRLET